jgi:uncharacterized membrane protein YeaQ/YmgE (transglycosylase-associated protein family)
MLGAVISVIASGFVLGALARLALPGPDPMPFTLTVLLGLSGSIVGGGIAAALFGAKHTFDTSNHAFVSLLLEIAAAILLLAAYRRYVQRRPLTGPEAYKFPSRGFGIQRMRHRLRQLGVDPDKLAARPGGDPEAQNAPLDAEQQAAELQKLRELRDQGVLTEEEYERARQRLRRY